MINPVAPGSNDIYDASKVSSNAFPDFPPNINNLTQTENSERKRFPSASTNQEREVDHPTNVYETLIHLLKGNTGAGLLAIPEAFKYSGYIGGLIYSPIMGLIAVHCMHLILGSSRELCRRAGVGALNYEMTAKVSFERGPKAIRRYSNVIYNAISFFLILTQLGFCCVYMVFISQNLFQAVECIVGETSVTEFDYMLFILVPILLLCYIPDLKYLAPVSLVAFAIQVVGLIIIFFYLVRDLPTSKEQPNAFGNLKQFPHFFGIVTYAYEGIGLVLPLENNMKRPKSFPGMFGVLNTGMVIETCLIIGMGFFGYVVYGQSVQGSITLNLPGNETLAQTVQILLSFAMFLTYPLQFYVPLIIMQPWITSFFQSAKSKLIAQYAFRTFLVLLTFGLAAILPNIGLFTNLIGAICSSMLAFIFPSIIDIVTFWPNHGRYNWKLIKNILIIGFGLLGFATGTFMSVVEIVKFLQESDHSIPPTC